MKKSFKNKNLQQGKIILRKGDEEIDLGYANIQATKVNYNKNFTMLWTNQIKNTGSIELDLLFWLIANMRGNWVNRITDEKLANELNVTRKTIAAAKHKLHDAGILKYEAKAIFINPWIIYRGTASKRFESINEYEHYYGIGDKKNEEKELKNSQKKQDYQFQRFTDTQKNLDDYQ